VEPTCAAPFRVGDALVAEQYHLRIPSRLEWIEPAVDYLTQRAVQCGAVGETRAHRLMIALHEALTNSLLHGNLILSLRRGGEEKRAHPRHALQQEVRVAPVDGDGVVDWGAEQEALARNVSHEGMSLLQSGLLASGRVLITIPAACRPGGLHRLRH
jgi:hypothetical protein